MGKGSGVSLPFAVERLRPTEGREAGCVMEAESLHVLCLGVLI